MTSMLPEEGEHLTTGWEPDLPAGDSLVRQAVLAHVAWADAVARAAGGTVVERPGWSGGFGGTSSPMLNWVLVTEPPRDWAALIGDIRDYQPADSPLLVISPIPTPDLAPMGLSLVGHPPLMWRPTSTITTEPATKLDVRQAVSPTELVDAERVLVEGYPLPELAEDSGLNFYRPELPTETCRVFVAYDGVTPVATSVALSAAGATVVENVAVLPSARGLGAGAAITWAATVAWTDQPAVLIASDDGQPVYERLGFLRLVRWTCWMCA
ncbi:GNAT family N-acetyltransferase [Mycobacterium sp. Y57]|uniref:GNAT family N-acetyltransferase n=1 Tax=Mycolicibacterium xanthum TaxID=2796469 RepID=UPI001C848C11|nr:GNAT family N-acetyltransferase [Mycolicibacterium xanthum]MBX7433692.1 GNAT family N-acetyltransferase [Mycolicibacterium xanthum]